ncbi:5003_t:CDS:1 [Paraglomus brasilianum]|uniref:5003_t:CDS:1 n=1 Tax=Paraglomus brasilianum TaxID=144538 RepID=A0A9N9EIL7_9GLOM|nr:5003_t:CDS:1 [Paraglomus brasilianum]
MQESTATKNLLRQSQTTTHQGTSNTWMGYDTSLSEEKKMDTLWPSSTVNESETTLKETLLDGKQKEWRPTWQLMSGTPVTGMDQETIGSSTYLSLQDSCGDTKRLSDNMTSDTNFETMKTNLDSLVTWTMSSNTGATSEPVNGHMMHNNMSTSSWIVPKEKVGRRLLPSTTRKK